MVVYNLLHILTFNIKNAIGKHAANTKNDSCKNNYLIITLLA